MSESAENNPNKSCRPLRLGEVLVTRGVLTEEQLANALKAQRNGQGKLLGDILVQDNYASEADVTAALAASLGVPFCRVTERMVSPEAMALLPWPFIESKTILPMTENDDWITVAVEDFTNVRLVEEIETRTGKQVQVVAATESNIREIQELFAPEESERRKEHESVVREFSDIVDELNQSDLTVVEGNGDDDDLNSAKLEIAAADSPVIKLVNYLIRNAIECRASDIHIEPDDGECRVRFRIDGELVEQMKPPFKLVSAVVSRIKIMASMDISERRVPQDGGISVIVHNRGVDLRVSTMPTKFGEKVVIRVIDNNATLLNLNILGFNPYLLNRLRASITQRNGIILVTGPTGSGKSTTLYAVLNEIISDKRNISTIEDPIEYNMKGLNQFQVNKKAGFTFASALRALLRQDPDIVMVGEVRDVETAKLATEAALTGHLVFSTLHTNDAPSAITRLANMGVEPYLVAAALRGVLAQRLVRKLCKHCQVKQSVDPAIRQLISEATDGELDLDYSFVAEGCPRCRNTGCSGRIAVHEFLEVDEVMLASIGRNMDMAQLKALATERGYRPLIVDGLNKVRDGLIGLDSLFEVVGHLDDGSRPEATEQTAAA